MEVQNIFATPKTKTNAHGGKGLIYFSRLFGGKYKPLPIESAINFVDVALLPPGTSIGYHKHEDTTEIYLILEGRGEYLSEGQKSVVQRGDVLINHCGYHSLLNNSGEELIIYVVEAKIRKEYVGG